MYWSVWFSEKYRAISCCMFSFLLFFAVEMGIYITRIKWEQDHALAKEGLKKAFNQYQQRQAAWKVWQNDKANLQKGRVYMGEEKPGGIKLFLKQWQATQPDRKLYFNLETIVSPSTWHHTMSRQVYRLSLRFSVQNEAELLKIWQAKKNFPCVQIPDSITFSRTEGGRVEVEEQVICVQF